MKKMLLELPEKEREVIILRLSQNLAFAEIATELGITYEAARSRYRRALELIKEKFSLTENRENDKIGYQQKN
jgi:RNA polymerase sigma factor (sigma-70 family)